MAAAYDDRIDTILPKSDLFFSSCISFIPDGQITVLELGSGTGYATSKILETHPQAVITCMDHSPEMIACARQKPELESVEIIEQDIREPWPVTQYDVIMTTLCLHHIPGNDRLVLLRRVHDALSSGGLFICGDIIRPVQATAEEVYQDRWVKAMASAGLSETQIIEITASRRANYPEMETIPGCFKKMNQIGFSRVFMPYKHEISAVFIGMKE
ncbi:MAG TPA: class I SAM-dependent methyltransferase [Methanospirillum sp.]|nr:class I SAM-dependent methyltransferase [Methanospirillum sp.]